MNSTLADFLLDLSDPMNGDAFVRDAEGSMEAAGLSEGDRLAMRTGNYAVIRYQVLHGDLRAAASGLMPSEVREAFDFVHVEINHQTETSHGMVARQDEPIKRNYGPNTTYYPEGNTNAS